MGLGKRAHVEAAVLAIAIGENERGGQADGRLKGQARSGVSDDAHRGLHRPRPPRARRGGGQSRARGALTDQGRHPVLPAVGRGARRCGCQAAKIADEATAYRQPLRHIRHSAERHTSTSPGRANDGLSGSLETNGRRQATSLAWDAKATAYGGRGIRIASDADGPDTVCMRLRDVLLLYCPDPLRSLR